MGVCRMPNGTTGMSDRKTCVMQGGIYVDNPMEGGQLSDINKNAQYYKDEEANTYENRKNAFINNAMGGGANATDAEKHWYIQQEDIPIEQFTIWDPIVGGVSSVLDYFGANDPDTAAAIFAASIGGKGFKKGKRSRKSIQLDKDKAAKEFRLFQRQQAASGRGRGVHSSDAILNRLGPPSNRYGGGVSPGHPSQQRFPVSNTPTIYRGGVSPGHPSQQRFPVLNSPTKGTTSVSSNVDNVLGTGRSKVQGKDWRNQKATNADIIKNKVLSKSDRERLLAAGNTNVARGKSAKPWSKKAKAAALASIGGSAWWLASDDDSTSTTPVPPTPTPTPTDSGHDAEFWDLIGEVGRKLNYYGKPWKNRGDHPDDIRRKLDIAQQQADAASAPKRKKLPTLGYGPFISKYADMFEEIEEDPWGFDISAEDMEDFKTKMWILHDANPSWTWQQLYAYMKSRDRVPK